MPSREPELYKDKIEVSLDGRQIFYLFFGGAVIVGLVFVLGVMTGRRVEARGHVDRAQTQTARDPLAALDRLERTDHLSFRGALTGTAAQTEVEKAIGELEKRRTAGSVEKKPASPASAEPKPARPEKAEVKPDRPEVKAEPVTRPDADRARADKHDGEKKSKKHDDSASGETRSESKPDRSDAKRSDARDKPVTRPEGKIDGKADGKIDGKVEAKADRVDGRADSRAEPKLEAREARSETRSETRPEARLDPRSDAKPDAKPDARPDAKLEAKADAKATDTRVRFTLQLSSFQDRSEAEAFLTAVKSAGFQPYLTEAEVSGKGTFYRVRLGSYRSLDAANGAKDDYEKAAKKTAQVMRL